MKPKSKDPDYYKILGLPRNATLRDIKRAHRSLAKKHHPDGKGKTRSEEFVQIQEAYSVLSDPVRRLKYDRYGDPDFNEALMARLQKLGGPQQHPFFRFALKYHYKRMVDLGCPQCADMENCTAWRKPIQAIRCPRGKTG